MSTSHNTLNLLETLGVQAHSIIGEMDELFPPTTPDPTQSIEHIMYRAGQRSVVEWLHNRLQENGT